MTSSQAGWTLVVAMTRNEVIGHNNSIPFRISSDLQRFKRMTMGHCLFMGKNTFKSIGRALPGRQTIVLSRAGFRNVPKDVCVVSGIEDVERQREPKRKVMVVGGAQVYELALPYCNTMWITRVDATLDGDVVFPDMEWSDWKMEYSEPFEAGPKDEYATEFQVWTRNSQ